MKSFLALTLLVVTANLSADPARPDLPVPNARPIDYEKFRWFNELPEGREIDPALQHQSFFSEKNQADVGYYLYLPHGYYDPANVSKRYPVIYQLHGGRPGAEYKGIKPFTFVRDSMESGLLPKCIFVVVNGGKLSHYDWKGVYGRQAFIELTRHIDRTYRTIADRKGRFVMGGSQGGRGVLRYIFKHPELIGSAIAVAAGNQWELEISKNGGVESQHLTIDDGSINTWDLALAYSKNKDAPTVRVMIVIGDHDNNYPGNLAYSKYLNELGIDHALSVVPDQGHGIDYNAHDIGEKMMRFHAEGWKHYGLELD